MTESGQDMWEMISGQLEKLGIEFEALGSLSDEDGPIRVVCMGAHLKDSVDELGQALRDRVLMVRVDQETLTTLDAWVQTGAVKSRSEAAALFIREGLKLRERELTELEGALRGVDEAKEKLRKKAKEVLGNDDE